MINIDWKQKQKQTNKKKQAFLSSSLLSEFRNSLSNVCFHIFILHSYYKIWTTEKGKSNQLVVSGMYSWNAATLV